MTVPTLHQLLHLTRPQPAKPEPIAADWLDPRWHDSPNGYQRASTHNTLDAFRQRQIARGLKVRNP